MLRLRKQKEGKRNYETVFLGIFGRFDNWYGRVLAWSLHNRWKVLIASFAIFFGSLMLIGKLGTEAFPESDESRVNIMIELQPGTRVEKSVALARKLDSIISAIPEVRLMSTSAGSDEDASGFIALFGSQGSNIINYMIGLKDVDERERSVWDVAEEIRTELKAFPEIINYNVQTGGMGAQSNTVDVEIYGYNLDKTTMLAHQVADKLKDIKGARDVQISREEAKPELRVELDREKMAAVGLNTAMVSSAIYNRVAGLTATLFREEGEEYNVRIRFMKEYRNSITDIENIALQTTTGKTVRLGDVGEVREYWSPPNIERKRRERMVTVSVTPYRTSMGVLASEIQKVLDTMEIPKDVMIDVGGAYEDQQEGFADLGLLFILSLILVYLVMASQFESFRMPFIIMISIPFAFTGVILALLITGTTLSLIAGLGAVMLIGIVVKNAIVLVDFINLMRDRGYALDEAIVESGKSRLRPVLMTALTTILGMLPLALSTGEGSEIWSPMGISVIGGLIFSTLITMVIVPVFYRIFTGKAERDKKTKVRSKFVFMDI